MQGRTNIDQPKGWTLEGVSARLVGFLYDTTNAFLKSLAWLLWPRGIPVAPQKICLYRIGNIGDTACAVPALIAVRRTYPSAHITLLTASSGGGRVGAEELLDHAWFIDRILKYRPEEVGPIRGALQLAKTLRDQSFDLWIYFPQELITLPTLLRNLAFVFLCGVEKAIGFEISTIKLWARAQSKCYRFDNEVDRLLGILRRWGIPIKSEVEYDLPVTPATKRSAMHIIEQYRMRKGKIVGLMPGASYPENRWSLENFAKVGKFILAHYPDHHIVVFGGPDDREKGQYLTRVIGSGRVVDLSGRLSVLETHLFLHELTLLISNNTGLMHMAALAGVPVIAIFSPMELNGKWAPYGNHSKVLMHRERSECDGFYYRKFPGSYECINTVTPQEVRKEIERVLGKRYSKKTARQ